MTGTRCSKQMYDMVSCSSDVDFTHFADVDVFPRCTIGLPRVLRASSRVEWDPSRNRCCSSRQRVANFAAGNCNCLAAGPDSRGNWFGIVMGGDALLLVQFRPIVLAQAYTLVSFSFLLHPPCPSPLLLLCLQKVDTQRRANIHRVHSLPQLECSCESR